MTLGFGTREWTSIVALIASFFLPGACAFGQATARIHGLVTDSAGSIVAGARVVARSSPDNTDRAFVSSQDGLFEADGLNPGRYRFQAAKSGFADSQVSELDLVSGEDQVVNLTLGARGGFLKRLTQGYFQDWRNATEAGPEPPRRALPSPLPSPPFPNADWSYGASPEIGAPDTNIPPLMGAVYAGPGGKAWERSRVKVYGWLDGSLDLSTSQQSNFPAINDAYPNRVELNQAVLIVERVPDTVQTDHLDWGFHISGLYGADYRFTTDLGYFSDQLLKYHRRYGFDPELEYADLYIPRVAGGLNIRVGRAFSLPGIEGQMATGNYTGSHSLLYYAGPTTNTGITGTVRVNNSWLFQLGFTAGNDVAPWTGDRKPSASACISYTFNSGKDNLYPCVNGLNDGKYAFNNGQTFDATWYHKFNASWHTATEVLYLYQLGAPSASGPLTAEKGTFPAVCPAGEIRCRAAVWAVDNYVERQLSAESYISFRADFLDDLRGQLTGNKTRYAEATLMWGHWVGSTVLLRPEIRFDRALDRPAYDGGTRRGQFQALMDVIFRF